MVNPETGEPEDIECSVADMEVLKQENWIMVFTPNKNSIISGRDHSGQGGGHGSNNLSKRKQRAADFKARIETKKAERKRRRDERENEQPRNGQHGAKR